ncbi:MAG: hypothetical protein GY859_24030 [Desulfobacterales bacterium]|nr:hypothetical protein [Desulfobacterales bacterium]
MALGKTGRRPPALNPRLYFQRKARADSHVATRVPIPGFSGPNHLKPFFKLFARHFNPGKPEERGSPRTPAVKRIRKAETGSPADGWVDEWMDVYNIQSLTLAAMSVEVDRVKNAQERNAAPHGWVFGGAFGRFEEH